MTEREWKTHPYYSDGFYDAQSGDPLFPDAHPAYKSGWEAYHRCVGILEAAGFNRSRPGENSWTKTTVIPLPQRMSHERDNCDT